MDTNVTVYVNVTVTTVTLTCLSPNREIFVLLNIQHDLQAVPRSAFQSSQQRVSV